MSTLGSIGLKVSTGRAVVVVLRGTRVLPEMVVRYEISLSDPWLPESLHPYHQELGRSGTEGEEARVRGCRAAQASARSAIRGLVAEMKAHGLRPCGAVLVVRSLGDPNAVTGAHARAHALEASLYGESAAQTLRECGVRVALQEEKTVKAWAVRELRQTARHADAMLKMFVRQVGTPWRSDEKEAALAAWVTLPDRED
ncbi:MAG: hypothetical protein ACHQ6T_02565 [Myxococcota bacterium]